MLCPVSVICCLWLFWYMPSFSHAHFHLMQFHTMGLLFHFFLHCQVNRIIIYHFGNISYDSWWMIGFCIAIKLLVVKFLKWKNSPVTRLQVISKKLLQTLVTPPQNEHLNPFENDIYNMIGNIEFTYIRNTRFQTI